MQMGSYTILLVDDDPIITAGTGSDLEEKGYTVTTANSGERAIELLESFSFDVVITDLVMTPVGGIDVLKKAKEIHPETIVIILTGYGNMNSAIAALRLDADDYLLKPCEPEEMYFRLSRCLQKRELDRKVKVYESLLRVCTVCKRIWKDTERGDGRGEWTSMEKYLHDNEGVTIQSTYCPVCSKEFAQMGVDLGVDLDES